VSVEYDALSYAWGTDVSSRRALVDGYPVHVTESLDMGLRRLPSWVIDFPALRQSDDFDIVYNTELSMKEGERRRGSVRLSVDQRTLYTHGRYVGTICATRTFSSGATHEESHGKIPDAELYDFYHNILKLKGVTPHTFLHALQPQEPTNVNSNHFVTLSLGSRDQFHPDISLGHCNLLLAEEGHFGRSWHEKSVELQAGDSLVCLFGTVVPLILGTVSVTGTDSYEMIDVAYVPGYGDRILDNPYLNSSKATWIDFAVEGGREYAIV
jgi:hypothetical protein